ncbi:MAG: tyrosine recombinase XerC [Bifidobacterium dentium]
MTEKRKKRRQFGTVLLRRNPSGKTQTWIGRYAYRGVRCQRSFGKDGRIQAQSWLEEEKLLVDLDRRDIQRWVPWSERRRKEMTSHLTFDQWADHYINTHRRKDGQPLTGSSKRNLRADVAHLREAFGTTPLTSITPAMIHEWYETEHPEGPWAWKRECERLKSILEEATKPSDGASPLIETNPFMLPIPPDPDPKSWRVQPVDGETLRMLYTAMPAYTRIAVYLAAMVGGLRTGELCALQREDINLEGRTLTVRYSVNRGADDLGRSRLGRTKTPHSRRTCPIPDLIIPLLKEHLNQLDPDNPMLLQARRGEVIAQTTLTSQLKRARERIGLHQAVTFRTLRVTHTTLLMQYGGTVREAMDEIGDQTMEVVLKHYARTIPEHRRLVVNRMAEAMAHDDHAPATTLKTPDGTITDPANPDTTYKRIRECLEELASILEDTSKTNYQDGRHE